MVSFRLKQLQVAGCRSILRVDHWFSGISDDSTKNNIIPKDPKVFLVLRSITHQKADGCDPNIVAEWPCMLPQLFRRSADSTGATTG